VSNTAGFEATVLPWLDAGYNLARWLLHDDAAADDAVQDAAMRALRYFDSLRGSAAKPWFLGIVRNVCFTYLKERSGRNEQTGYDDDEIENLHYAAGFISPDPAELLQQGREHAIVDAAIRALPPPLREVIVLRELEGMEYAEIAQVAAIPLGTVMSRLSRARARLKAVLTQSGVHV
jgi:RNA polymerase sigma factor (sigma-70 family)